MKGKSVLARQPIDVKSSTPRLFLRKLRNKKFLILILNEVQEVIKHHLKKILDRIGGPDEQTVKRILSGIGIKESDERYESLKAGLSNLVGNRTKEKAFSIFFSEISSQLYKKVVEREKELIQKVQEETSKNFKEQITRSREQLTADVVTSALLPEILMIKDRPTYEILRLLYEGEKNYELLKRILDLGNDELIWRLNYLRDLGLIHYPSKDELSLSEVGKAIFEKRGAEFERFLDLLIDDKFHRLSLKAVGGDKMMAEKLESLVKNGRMRGHKAVIEKLNKEFGGDYQKISQVIFGMREMGDRHEKHFGLKIVDHEASGELIKHLLAGGD